MPFLRLRRPRSGSSTPNSLGSNYGDSTPASLASPAPSRCSSEFSYSEFHDSNTLDAQLGPRLRALQDSLQNPELSPSVRNILQTAYHQFERESARNHEALPVYTADIPPPYQRD